MYCALSQTNDIGSARFTDLICSRFEALNFERDIEICFNFELTSLVSAAQFIFVALIRESWQDRGKTEARACSRLSCPSP